MKYFVSAFLSFLLLTSPLFAQSERPETIIIPVSSLGNVSEVRKQILQNTLTDELKTHFRIVPQEKYEEALEQVFQELNYEECTEDSCIIRIQEMLQVEDVFNLQVIGEGKDTQLNLTWRTLDEKRNETDVCLGCGTFQLNDKVRGLVEKLVGNQVVEKPVVVVEKKTLLETNKDTQTTKNNNILFRIIENGKWVWVNDGNKKIYNTYNGELKNNLPDGKGVEFSVSGTKVYEGYWKEGKKHGDGIEYEEGGMWIKGEWKNGKYWNTERYNKWGGITYKFINGVRK